MLTMIVQTLILASVSWIASGIIVRTIKGRK